MLIQTKLGRVSSQKLLLLVDFGTRWLPGTHEPDLFPTSEKLAGGSASVSTQVLQGSSPTEFSLKCRRHRKAGAAALLCSQHVSRRRLFAGLALPPAAPGRQHRSGFANSRTSLCYWKCEKSHGDKRFHWRG